MSEKKAPIADAVEGEFEVRAKGGILRLKYSGPLSELVTWCAQIVSTLGSDEASPEEVGDHRESEPVARRSQLDRVAAELGVQARDISSANLFGIKGQDVRLYGASARWSVTDSVCVPL
jgi:hypothetical protein